MKIKVYNYALWRDEASGAYFTKVNGTSVEISKEVYYELMKHENEDRYQEATSRKRLPQFGHPLGDEYELIWMSLQHLRRLARKSGRRLLDEAANRNLSAFVP